MKSLIGSIRKKVSKAGLKIPTLILLSFVGFVLGTVGSYIIFANSCFSLVFGIIGACGSVPVFTDYLISANEKRIKLQFIDFLESLGNSFSAGKNTEWAFSDALDEIRFTYGEKAYLATELRKITDGLKNGTSFETLMEAFCGDNSLEAIDSFKRTFVICLKNGGNLKRVSVECRDLIVEKIESEMEINACISGGKNELRILTVMPFVISLLMKCLWNTGNTEGGLSAGLAATIIFVLAFLLGKKITDIKI